MHHWLLPRLLLLLPLILSEMGRRTASGEADIVRISHFYCQPLSEASPASAMMGFFPSERITRKLSGRRVQILSAPWPSLVGRTYWVDPNWDAKWALFYTDAKLTVPGRPDEEDLKYRSTRGMVSGRNVVQVRILKSS